MRIVIYFLKTERFKNLEHIALKTSKISL